MLIIIFFILLSCATFVLETLVSFQTVYSDGCGICKPVDANDPDFASLTASRSDAAVVDHCRQNNCEPRPHTAFVAIELVSVVMFTFEYATRLISCHSTRSDVEIMIGENDVKGHSAFPRVSESSNLLAKNICHVCTPFFIVENRWLVEHHCLKVPLLKCC